MKYNSARNWFRNLTGIWKVVLIIIFVIGVLIFVGSILFAFSVAPQEGVTGDFITYLTALSDKIAGRPIYEIGEWTSQINYRYHPIFLWYVQFLVLTQIPYVVHTFINLGSITIATIFQYKVLKLDEKFVGFAILLPIIYIVFDSNLLANIVFGNINSILMGCLGLIMWEILHKRRIWLISILISIAAFTKPQWMIGLGLVFFYALTVKDLKYFLKVFLSVIGIYVFASLVYGVIEPNGFDHLSSYYTFLFSSGENYIYDLSYPSYQQGLKNILIMVIHQEAAWIDIIVWIVRVVIILLIGYQFATRRSSFGPSEVVFYTSHLYLSGMFLIPEYQELTMLPLVLIYILPIPASEGRRTKVRIIKMGLVLIGLVWGMTHWINAPGFFLLEPWGPYPQDSLIANIIFFNEWIPTVALAGWTSYFVLNFTHTWEQN